jgi:hypothetical protein
MKLQENPMRSEILKGKRNSEGEKTISGLRSIQRQEELHELASCCGICCHRVKNELGIILKCNVA